MKLCILGCGLRTPLLLHGLIHSDLPLREIALYDVDRKHSILMASVAASLCQRPDIHIREFADIENAIENSHFVISSIRVGDMKMRAIDEGLALDCGFAGQETTGPAGFAMALRTIPVALAHARLVEKLAPKAWIINFTNPAGIITQAISTHTGAKVMGICDTPAELFLQISHALGEPLADVECEYFGLNHLGWVRSVRVRGDEVSDQIFEREGMMERLYPADLFDVSFLRALHLIPTEYLFFYYNAKRARDNQGRAGATRGEELLSLNAKVWKTLAKTEDSQTALVEYRRYLNRRNSSYMRLESKGESAFDVPDGDWDPFEAATGYHRIAVEAVRALISSEPTSMVLNVPNGTAIGELASEDVVEVRCQIDQNGPRPLAVGVLPGAVQGLVLTVKHYERLTIRAAVEKRLDIAALALTMNPIIGNWGAAHDFLSRLMKADAPTFADFR